MRRLGYAVNMGSGRPRRRWCFRPDARSGIAGVMYFVPFSAPVTAGKDRRHGGTAIWQQGFRTFFPVAGWIPAPAAIQAEPGA